MAVLVEAISVIVRRDAIERKYANGWRGFVDDVPNATLCADAEVARVGFMCPDEARHYIELICAKGLTFLSNGMSADIAVVDQLRGPTTPCDWLEFAQVPFGDGGGRVSACWLFEGPRIASGLHVKGSGMTLATPSGWEFETSLSANFIFVPSQELEGRLEFLRSEDGMAVFKDIATGKEVFIASRTKG